MILLLNYPAQMAGLVAVTSITTALKLALVNLLFAITLLALAGVLAKAVYHRLRRA